MQPVDLDSPSSARAQRLHNFSAGPGTLPLAVMEEVRDELPVFGDLGSSIMEVSHRSAAYTKIDQDAKQHLRDLLGLGDEWHILFLQGGASMQFHQVPLNFLPDGGTADYLVTGSWAKKALKEAVIVGKTRGATARTVASSEEAGFTYIPKRADWDLDDGASYLHFTSNNTIYGTQFKREPQVDVPLVCDASSDFLSRRLDLDRYGLIYAGAQKNIGPAGVTVVLVRDEMLQQRRGDLPTLLDYGTHTAKLFHTPPVFAVYAVEKVLRWVKDLGGLEAMEKRNDDKAATLYARIDKTDFYRGTARADSRSKMNVTFRLPSEALEQQFLAEAKQHGLVALKGYRTVGGVRASIYNAMPPEGVDALVSFMDAFEKQNG